MYFTPAILFVLNIATNMQDRVIYFCLTNISDREAEKCSCCSALSVLQYIAKYQTFSVKKRGFFYSVEGEKIVVSSGPIFDYNAKKYRKVKLFP